MPSPFPGMDPYIEAQKWSGFHHLFIAELAQRLVALVRPKYDVDPEDRIYIETAEPDRPSFRADVAVSEGQTSAPFGLSGTAVLDVEPKVVTLPMPVEEKEPFLVIREIGSREVVAIIELLSPTNKRSGSDGRKEYLKKRTDILRTRAHLVEIDLLLSGQRLPMVEPLSRTTDYCAIVSRAGTRPRAELFEWPLRHPLPRIPVPLANGDPDALLDLQAALTTVYDRSGYDYSVQYNQRLGIAIRPEDVEWMGAIAKLQR